MIEVTWKRARKRLLTARTPGGWWEGELSSSALSTATACAALTLAGEVELSRKGMLWLAEHQNDDGGFGDTTVSPSNLSTTALAWMALGLGGEAAARARAHAWLEKRLGSVDPRNLARGLEEVYADDHTFAVPILVACAAGGAFGEGRQDAWAPIARLPFELAALPRALFRWLGLPVVSYALPALIAIGQAIEHQRPSRNPLTRLARVLTRGRTRKVLERIQPEGGGFLEATPLTSFVVISLIAGEQRDHPVVERGLGFLRRSMRGDGSWPIDTNLATWLTTLAVNAIGEAEAGTLDWLLAQQFRTVHPYTGAAPGGWAWTDLPGGVPDADDTAGAVLVVVSYGTASKHRAAALAGAKWLCDLQNKDGGMPTFCRGWGKLPFDKSCPDLSGHALRAWAACDSSDLRPSMDRAQAFLVRTQREDGSWIPLWFGNQEEPRQQNPVYGTSRVLRACGVAGSAEWQAALERALEWLFAAQDSQGGFGGAAGLEPTVEETALALEALADAASTGLGAAVRLQAAMERAARFLSLATAEASLFEAQPIGLYFAKLWYSEQLYPLIFTVSALRRFREVRLPGAVGPVVVGECSA